MCASLIAQYAIVLGIPCYSQYIGGVFPISLPNRQLKNILTVLVCSLPALVYYVSVVRYAVNVPNMDDYIAILEFLCKYDYAEGIDKVMLLFSQHNEHRIFCSRLLYVAYHQLFGTVNFRHIIYIGTFQLLPLLGLLVFFIRKAVPAYWRILSCICSVAVFDLVGWENMNFAMAGVQNYGIFLLCAAGIYCYSKQGKWYTLAGFIMQGLCVFSSGNGILAAAAMLVYTVFSGNRVRIGVSIAGLCAFTALYFWGYVSPVTGHPSKDLGKAIVFMLKLVGAYINYDDPTQGMWVGALLLGIFALLLPIGNRLKVATNVLPIFCFAVFLGLSMAVTSLFRSSVPGIPANSSRYLLYPHLLVVVLLVFFCYKFTARKWAAIVVAAFMVIQLLAFNINYRGGVGSLQWLHNNLVSQPYYYPDSSQAAMIIERSCKKGVYCKP